MWDFTHLLVLIKDFSILGYLIIAILAFFEAFAFVGLIIPGSVAVIIGGFLVAQGSMDFGDLFIFVAIAAILGDNFSFYLGQKGIISFKDGNKIFRPNLLKKGENYFEKHGSKSVFFGRFIGWVRPIVPFVAGVFNLNRKTFLTWDILSGICWAIVHIAIGYFFGQAWRSIALWSARGSIFIGILVIFLILFYLLKWLIFKKGKQLWHFFKSVCGSIKQAVIDNPAVQKLVNKHPLFFRWLKRRLARDNFFGLPLTLSVLAFIYILSLLIGIIEDFVSKDIIVSADMHIVNLLAVFRSIEATRFFLWITVLGKWQVVFVFFLATLAILWLWRKRTYIIPLLITIFGAEFFTGVAKLIFHRPRPASAVYLEHSFSFPSGHATIAMAFYGFLIYIIIRNAQRWRVKLNVFFSGLILIALIGLSRLYLGVHYVSDVWGGYLIGALWLIIGISLAEYLLRRKKLKKIILTTTKLKIIFTIIVGLALVFYTWFAFNYNPRKTVPVILPKQIVVQKIDDVFSREQLRYTETLVGERMEPINFIILADNDQQLKQAFKKAGWFLANKIDIFSLVNLSKAILFKQRDERAPMTPSFWNSKVHDFGFEKATTANNARARHHARFWKTKNRFNHKNVYLGTASLDTGVKWGITHKINPDIDTEREIIFQALKNAGVIKQFTKQRFVKPMLGENFSGDPFFTDGQSYFIVLN